MISFHDVVEAQQRVTPYIHRTPIMTSSLLNEWLGSKILFKAECLQKTGAFKVRGALNVLAKLAEQNTLPTRVVANSSGNHAQAVAYAARIYQLDAEIFSAKTVSAVKAAATRYLGARLSLFPTRTEADLAVVQAAETDGTLWIPPYNHPDIIAGQGTLALEALQEVPDVDVVCAPCGGGGLLSGSLIASRELCPEASVIGAEPLAANDAAESRRQGKIVTLTAPPVTLADGAATPSLGELTFEYVRQLDGFYEVSEPQIAYWTQWLHHLLKLHVEPTSAMAMQAVVNYLRSTSKNQTVLVLLSGGNIDTANMQRVYADDWLAKLPSLAGQT